MLFKLASQVSLLQDFVGGDVFSSFSALTLGRRRFDGRRVGEELGEVDFFRDGEDGVGELLRREFREGLSPALGGDGDHHAAINARDFVGEVERTGYRLALKCDCSVKILDAHGPLPMEHFPAELRIPSSSHLLFCRRPTDA